MIHSDWHIHTNASYDARMPLETLIAHAREQGLVRFGVTDHANLNDAKFIGDLKKSAANVKRLQATCPEMVLGVEFTPIDKPRFDYIAKHGNQDGYIEVEQSQPYDLELAATKEELLALGVRYAVGAAHCRVDYADTVPVDTGMDASIREWFRQQMWLIQDERVTILGHPWYNGEGEWYQDFSVIPQAMHDEMAAALLEYRKYAECNVDFFRGAKTSEKFRHQYAQYLRFLFEKGIPITYGSDCHSAEYPDLRSVAEKYLSAAGFRDGDFSEVAEEDLW